MEICKVCLKKISGTQRFADYHNACLNVLFDSSTVSPILTFDRNIFKTEISQKYVHGMSISGVQKKLSVKIEKGTLSLTNAGGTYILKPTVEEYPNLSENEHLSMLIGKALDIETPPLGLVKFSDGELTYIIKRFDWKGTDKIAKEDMVQISALNRDDEGRFKYDLSYEEVGLKLKEVAGGKMFAVLDFFNRLIHNFLIQNGDYHLKNISVIAEKLSKQGFYERLAPNYDSVSTRMYFPNEPELALDLLQSHEIPNAHQEHGYFSRPDFEQLGGRIGLLPSATAVIFDKIKKRKAEILELVNASFLNSERKQKYQNDLNERLKVLGL